MQRIPGRFASTRTAPAMELPKQLGSSVDDES